MRANANQLRDIARERGLAITLAAMLAFGLALTMCDTLEIPQNLLQTAALCAGCALLAIAFAAHWSVAVVGWSAIAAGGVVFAARTRLFPWLIGAVSDAAMGNMATINQRAGHVSILIALGLSLFCLVANRHREGFYPSLSLACVIALWSWVTGSGDNPWLFAPSLFALTALFARSRCERTGAARVVSMAALAVAAALVFLPSGNILNDTLASFAEKVRRVAYDYLFYNEPRTIYSIQYDGFQPLGARLGGPVANPSDREVMRVKTSRTLLLRGVTKDTYTGSLWTDQALSSRRYLYLDPRWRSIRDNLLDSNRPLERLRDADLFAPVAAEVTMLSESMTTLFVPHRLTALSAPPDMVLYFNSTGEVFATKNLAAGDSYAVRAPTLDFDDPRLPALAAAAAVSGASDWDGVTLDAYRALPQTVSPEVYQLVNRITEDKTTQLEKLAAIRDYLKGFRYTLTPSTMPPANMDFVSFFLLEGKEGYCTYFASAMAVSARIAGIPARYVEGYVARPGEDGVALVTGMNAHAWVEAYLPGLGWISVDATPGLPPSGNPDTPDDTPPDDPDNMPPDDGEGDDPNNTAAPNESTPSPEPMGTPGAPTASPAPPVDPDSTEPPDAAPETEPEVSQPDDDDLPKRSLWWLWLLVALAAIGIAARVIWVMPETAARRRQGLDARLLTWYRAALDLLAACGTPAVPADTPRSLVRRAASLAPLLDAVAALAYMGRVPDAGTVEAAASAFGETFRRAPVKVKLTVWAGRFIHGAGTVARVP
jgi:transglutaminase-like putative cysteine protease